MGKKKYRPSFKKIVEFVKIPFQCKILSDTLGGNYNSGTL